MATKGGDEDEQEYRHGESDSIEETKEAEDTKGGQTEKNQETDKTETQEEEDSGRNHTRETDQLLQEVRQKLQESVETEETLEQQDTSKAKDETVARTKSPVYNSVNNAAPKQEHNSDDKKTVEDKQTENVVDRYGANKESDRYSVKSDEISNVNDDTNRTSKTVENQESTEDRDSETNVLNKSRKQIDSKQQDNINEGRKHQAEEQGSMLSKQESEIPDIQKSDDFKTDTSLEKIKENESNATTSNSNPPPEPVQEEDNQNGVDEVKEETKDMRNNQAEERDRQREPMRANDVDNDDQRSKPQAEEIADQHETLPTVQETKEVERNPETDVLVRPSSSQEEKQYGRAEQAEQDEFERDNDEPVGKDTYIENDDDDINKTDDIYSQHHVVEDHKEKSEDEKEILEDNKETSGNHKETPEVHKEIREGHKEVSKDSEEVPEDHEEMPKGHKETQEGHKEMPDDHEEMPGDHKEIPDETYERTGTYREPTTQSDTSDTDSKISTDSQENQVKIDNTQESRKSVRLDESSKSDQTKTTTQNTKGNTCALSNQRHASRNISRSAQPFRRPVHTPDSTPKKSASFVYLRRPKTSNTGSFVSRGKKQHNGRNKTQQRGGDQKKRNDYFQKELQRLRIRLGKEAENIKRPEFKEHVPFVWTSLEPYYNTYVPNYLINLPDEELQPQRPVSRGRPSQTDDFHQGYTTRSTAIGLCDPWKALEMDKHILPKLEQPKHQDKEKSKPAKKKRDPTAKEGSTRLPKFPVVDFNAGKENATRMFPYSDVPKFRTELKGRFSSNAQRKVDKDYKRTKDDFYRMDLHRLDEVHPVNRPHMRKTYFAYLQNTPGSRKALKDCVKTLNTSKPEQQTVDAN